MLKVSRKKIKAQKKCKTSSGIQTLNLLITRRVFYRIATALSHVSDFISSPIDDVAFEAGAPALRTRKGHAALGSTIIASLGIKLLPTKAFDRVRLASATQWS